MYCITGSTQVKDADENDSVTYKLDDRPVFASDDSIRGIDKPIDIKNDDVILNFDVQDKMKGYFEINITAEDKGSRNIHKNCIYYVHENYF